MSLIDNSLCASDCKRTTCLRHRTRRPVTKELHDQQSWSDFSKQCEDYEAPLGWGQEDYNELLNCKKGVKNEL